MDSLRYCLNVSDCLNASREALILQHGMRNDTVGGRTIGGIEIDEASVREQYSELFGKYIHYARNDRARRDQEEAKRRERAKRANGIFRMIYKSSGLAPLFFDNFLLWSDYVEGKMSEEEFMEKVREEASRKVEALKC